MWRARVRACLCTYIPSDIAIKRISSGRCGVARIPVPGLRRGRGGLPCRQMGCHSNVDVSACGAYGAARVGRASARALGSAHTRTHEQTRSHTFPDQTALLVRTQQFDSIWKPSNRRRSSAVRFSVL